MLCQDYLRIIYDVQGAHSLQPHPDRLRLVGSGGWAVPLAARSDTNGARSAGLSDTWSILSKQTGLTRVPAPAFGYSHGRPHRDDMCILQEAS